MIIQNPGLTTVGEFWEYALQSRLQYDRFSPSLGTQAIEGRICRELYVRLIVAIFFVVIVSLNRG